MQHGVLPSMMTCKAIINLSHICAFENEELQLLANFIAAFKNFIDINII